METVIFAALNTKQDPHMPILLYRTNLQMIVGMIRTILKLSQNLLKVIGSFIQNYVYTLKFNFCKNKMHLDKVTWNNQSLSVCFFKIFKTVAIIFHWTTLVKSASLDVTGS